MASTTNLIVRSSFRDLTKLFKDAAQTEPVTVADGTQTMLAVRDTGPNGYVGLASVALKVLTLGDQSVVQFTGTERIDLPAPVAANAAPNGAHFEFDFLFYIPQMAMANRFTLFSFGRSSSSNDSGIYDVCCEPNGTFTVRSRPQTGGVPVTHTFGSWAFDKPIALTVVRSATGTTKAIVNDVDLGEFGAGAPFTGTGNYNYATIGASRNNNNGAGTNRFIGYLFTARNYGLRTDADRLADHAELYASRPAVVVSPSITIANEIDQRGFSSSGHVYRLAGTIANVAGTPAKLFSRVLKQSDGSVAKAYADTGATFSNATTFAGGQITGIPAGGPYVLETQARAADDTVLATIKGTVSFLVGKKLLLIGSSTPDRLGYEYTGAAPAVLGHFQANPVSTGGNYSWTSAVGAGGRTLAAALTAATGEPTIIINAGVGSTTLGGSWATAGASGLSVALTAMEKVGTDYDGLIMGVGANDAFKPYSATNATTILNDHDHARKLAVPRNILLAAMGKADIPTVVMGMNNRVNDTDQPIGSDGSARGTMGRGGEILFVRSLAKATYVSSMDLGVASGDIHLTQGGQEGLGTRTGVAMGNLLTGAASRLHPRITAATIVADGAEVTIEHSSGNDLSAQPAAGYSGFRVYDDLGALVADSENAATVVTKVSATKVKVPFTVDPARAYVVAHQNGTWTKPVGNILKDNNGLPVVPTIMGVGEVMVGGQRVTVTNV